MVGGAVEIRSDQPAGGEARVSLTPFAFSDSLRGAGWSDSQSNALRVSSA